MQSHLQSILEQVNTLTPQAFAFIPPRPASSLDDLSVYSRPDEQDAEEVARVERELHFPLPISLVAFSEAIGHVSFLGTHPVLNPVAPPANAEPLIGTDAGLSPPGISAHILRDSQAFGFPEPLEPPAFPLDPLALPDPLALSSLAGLAEYLSELDEAPRRGGVVAWPLAPDDRLKALLGGKGYDVNLPDPRADTIFPDWKKDYFVAYLRRAFRWGGFPGWERHFNPPMDLIQDLSRDLLPI